MDWIFWFTLLPQLWYFITYSFTQKKSLSQLLHSFGFDELVIRRVLGLIWIPEKPQGIV